MKNYELAITRSLVLLALTLASVPSLGGSGMLAETPPMGWNSWDGYGTSVNEEQFRANVRWFAEHLKPYGWQYVVIDMEWFVKNPLPQGNSKTFQYSMDEYGRYIPPEGRFPSAACASLACSGAM